MLLSLAFLLCVCVFSSFAMTPEQTSSSQTMSQSYIIGEGRVDRVSAEHLHNHARLAINHTYSHGQNVVSLITY